ncbi:superfamily I DNA/RNA helicase [Elusimicrobium posterum]|uniref:UvrD-helicase domain-containing protein n=1 Tax=Elusimicrobium posterum TaxID=3116653 RepID=UPI003C75CC1D
MSIENLVKSLNPAQKEAVEYNSGPCLIIAGAGTGKTKTLTTKIAYLIEQGVNPSRILAVTFTNKAAAEMRSRVEALAPVTAAECGFTPSIVLASGCCAKTLRF